MNFNRKRFLRIGVPLTLGLLLIGCEKVVTVDLNKADPHLVIVGDITDQHGPASVTLSKTGTYFDQSLNFPPVQGALVLLTDDLGNSDTLFEQSPGQYFSKQVVGSTGRTYSLVVRAEGREYDASSTMPQKVPIDTIYSVRRASGGVGPGGESGYDVYVTFQDPPDPGNYYRLNAKVSTLIPADSIDGRRYRLYTDKLTNGNEMVERIRVNRNVQAGDTVTIELLSIDKAAYDYFNTLRDVLSSDRSPTSLAPANPNTNLTNGSLGYFAAYTVDRRVFILH